MNQLNSIAEAQCLIAGSMLHLAGFDLASPIAFDLAIDLSMPLHERRHLGRWGNAAATFDVDLTEADHLLDAMKLALPVLAALHRGMSIGAVRVANHMRWLLDRGDIDLSGIVLLYQNCAPFMRGEHGVSAQGRSAMHAMLDEIVNEADAIIDRFVGLALDGPDTIARWRRHRLAPNASTEVLDEKHFYLRILQSMASVISEMNGQ
jgi:hypothetical protein